MIKRKVDIPAEVVERAHELVEGGLSARAAAKEVGVEFSHLYPRLKARGTRMRTQQESAAHRNRQMAHNQHAADATEAKILAAFATEDVSLYEIAERFNTARKNVRLILERAGIPQSEITKRQRRQTAAKSMIEVRKGVDLEKIAAEYVAGASLAQLAEVYGVAYVTLSVRLSQMGIEIRDNRKWEFRQDAFSTLTPEGAYWVGFIEADGNIAKDRPVVTIRLQERDISVLEAFADWLELDRENIKRRIHRDGFGECLLTLTSTQVYNDLRSYGIVPRKSWNWSGGFAIPPDLMPHFVRGWFDGDGVAAFNMGRPVNGKLSVVGISGLHESLLWLKPILDAVTPKGSVKLRQPRPTAPHFGNLEMTQKGAIAGFYEYANGYPRLERKWAKLDIHYEQWLKFGDTHWKADPEIDARIRAMK